jgi:hypothetical protein
MAKFMIMQWDWMGPVILQVDETEALHPLPMQGDRPAHPPRPTRIMGAIAVRSGARHRHGD